MIVTLDSKRRLTVPAAVPAKPGDHFLVDFDAEEDALVCRRIASKANWLKVLKACPVPMDDLPPRRREYFGSKLKPMGISISRLARTIGTKSDPET
jgi:DNA-binding transcriptional regulator/RsmH inhibitor MraZ